MDEVNQFKEQGNVRLIVPLAPDFDKVLFDLVQITATKSGFDVPLSHHIAEQVSQRAFQAIQAGNNKRNHQQVEVSVSHSPGQLTIRTEIPSLRFNEEIKFGAAEAG